MKTGIGDGAYVRRYGFAGAMAYIKKMGYDCIDYQAFTDTETPLYQNGEGHFEATLREHLKIVEDTGLEISQVHGPWRFPPRDLELSDREERFEKMAMSVRGTAMLKCRSYVIHALMPWGVQDAGHEQELYDINLEFMGRLCRVAEACGVVIAFENMPMPQLSLASPEACMNFAKAIDSPNFKVCLDTGHCTMLNVSPADAVRQLGVDYLEALHIHDNDGKRDLHWLPFTGVIDWNDFKQALADIGFAGSVSIETAPSAKYPEDIVEMQDRALSASASWLAGKEI